MIEEILFCVGCGLTALTAIISVYCYIKFEGGLL